MVQVQPGLINILSKKLFRSVITSDVQEESFLMFVTATIEYPIILAIFFLSCWADPKPKDIALEGK